MSVQSQIRWKRGDYISLGRAVSDFNKKINALNQEERKLYLPEQINYKEAKENITTRTELNRFIKNLRQFKKAGEETIIKTTAGEEITKWEYNVLKREQRRASRRLQKEIARLNIAENGQKYSRAEMGSVELNQLEVSLKNIQKLEKAVAKDFKELKRRLHNIGASDYNMRRSITYRENFLEELSKLKDSYPEFEKIYEKFNIITNPEKFFEVAQRSQALQDFFVWYKTPQNYADFASTLELADHIMEEYKLE